jgi:hypothetical protein
MAKFAEIVKGEVPRTPLPRTWMSMNIVEVKKGSAFAGKSARVGV